LDLPVLGLHSSTGSCNSSSGSGAAAATPYNNAGTCRAAAWLRRTTPGE